VTDLLYEGTERPRGWVRDGVGGRLLAEKTGSRGGQKMRLNAHDREGGGGAKRQHAAVAGAQGQRVFAVREENITHKKSV